MLSVPIPRQTNNLVLQIRYYPLDFCKPVINITLSLASGVSTLMGEVKDKIRQAVIDQLREEGQQATEEDVLPPIVCITKDFKIEMMCRNDFPISKLAKGFTLAAIEREKTGDMEMKNLAAV